MNKLIIFLLLSIFLINCEIVNLPEVDINDLKPNAPIKKWENGIVNYKLYDFNADEMTLIRNCMNIIEEKSDCVFFVENENENENMVKIFKENKNYIFMMGCSQNSYILLKTVNKRHINHELMHCLGFQHEHQRPDRDNYIIVNFENIIENNKKDFIILFDKNEKYIYDPLKYEYDYKSVLHYSNYIFSKNGEKTIESIDIYNTELSEIDIMKIQDVYRK
jgi:ABC-type Fe3+-citrate transport system substrate-binding protein